jgi:hypothetical protein
MARARTHPGYARHAGIAALIALSACSHDPSKEMASELQTVHSWSSCALLATRAWRDREAPPHYVLRVLQLSEQADSQSLEALHKLGAPPNLQRQVLLTTRAFPALRAAVTADDRGVASRSLDSLQAQMRALDALARSVPGTQ